MLKPGDELDWRKAANHCRMKRVHGVKGWRLPTMQELKKLRGARMLKSGRYWSGTQTSKGSDEVYILDQAARKVDVVAKDEAGIQVLCVRQR